MGVRELEVGFCAVMASENGRSSRMVFQGEAFPFSCGDGDHSGPRKPSAVGTTSGFAALDTAKLFTGDRVAQFFPDNHHHPPNLSWGAVRDGGSSCGRRSDCEEEDDGGEDEDEDVDEGDGFVSLDEGNNKANNNSSGSVQSSSVRNLNERASSQEHHSSFVFNGGVLAKDGNGGRRNLEEQQFQQCRMDGYENAVTIVETEPYYAHNLHGGDGSLMPAQKEAGGENGCGFSGRRDGGLTGGYWETLRTHLSDPITAVLMDDAMILPCGHSFGSGGLQDVFKVKACCKCSQPIVEDSIRPNLALRAAVQAFRSEEESQAFRASKRRRDRPDQEKCSYDDASFMDLSRTKGVQFPFAVSDRVIIKGNKRTPQRFVGRIAVVTTQCLNGWYVVKTLDNAESVKLQYRSLAKLTDDQGPPKMNSNKTLPPNWL